MTILVLIFYCSIPVFIGKWLLILSIIGWAILGILKNNITPPHNKLNETK